MTLLPTRSYTLLACPRTVSCGRVQFLHSMNGWRLLGLFKGCRWFFCECQTPLSNPCSLFWAFTSKDTSISSFAALRHFLQILADYRLVSLVRRLPTLLLKKMNLLLMNSRQRPRLIVIASAGASLYPWTDSHSTHSLSWKHVCSLFWIHLTVVTSTNYLLSTVWGQLIQFPTVSR